MGFHEKIEMLAEIRDIATKEHAVERQLENMIGEWEHTQLEFTQYRLLSVVALFTSFRKTDVMILKGTDKVMDILEDHIVKVAAMKGSAFVKPFESRIKAWEEKLFYMEDLMQEWLNLQKSWLYLEPIFASNDITQQMPAEARR